LGIMAQLPNRPGREQAAMLLQRLRQIKHSLEVRL
jgi:hypothetical protein